MLEKKETKLVYGLIIVWGIIFVLTLLAGMLVRNFTHFDSSNPEDVYGSISLKILLILFMIISVIGVWVVTSWYKKIHLHGQFTGLDTLCAIIFGLTFLHLPLIILLEFWFIPRESLTLFEEPKFEYVSLWNSWEENFIAISAILSMTLTCICIAARVVIYYRKR